MEAEYIMEPFINNPEIITVFVIKVKELTKETEMQPGVYPQRPLYVNLKCNMWLVKTELMTTAAL